MFQIGSIKLVFIFNDYVLNNLERCHTTNKDENVMFSK